LRRKKKGASPLLPGEKKYGGSSVHLAGRRELLLPGGEKRFFTRKRTDMVEGKTAIIREERGRGVALLEGENWLTSAGNGGPWKEGDPSS